MKKFFSVFVFTIFALGGAYMMFKRNDPALSQPRVIEVAMQMTIKEFIERNRLGMGPRVPQGYTIDVDKLTDVMPIFFDDNWIELHLLDDEQSFSLPPGRTLQVTQRAGRVIGISFRPFAQPKPLNEMRAYVNELITTVQNEGWRPTSSSKAPMRKEDFNAGGKSIFGSMEAPSGSKLQMTLRDYGLAPRHESFIVFPDPNHKPAESSLTYLLEIDVSDYDGAVYEDLIYPRRIFELGEPYAELPLRRWIEEPDWTPEKAGMIPTTPEERAKPDASNWKMPPK